MQASASFDPPRFPASTSRPIGAWRLLAGLLQGVLLYLLCHAMDLRAWPATSALLFPALFLAALFVPVVVIAGLGHLDRRQLILWTVAAALVLAGLGCWGGWRDADLPLLPHPVPDGVARSPGNGQYRIGYPAIGLVFLAAAGLFVTHCLIVAAARDRRRVAAYSSYFDTAWTCGVQLAFSALFTGVTWLVLFLGAQLFELLNLHFLTKLLQKQWFWIPVTAFAFACAMHLTDVRPAIVRGIRSLLLTLLSWLLPVTVLLVGGFLLTLPFTGLAPLWGTRRAAAVLLLAAGALVVLVNAAWQGGGEAAVARPVRWSARAACLLLAPLALVAIHALYLRVAEHGWTGERVHAAACMLVAACYAAGYCVAALRPGWLPLLAKVNIGTAFVVPAVILALSSPLADPARIAVASQVARLESGRVKPDKFDFVFLRFDAARFGRAALDHLERTAAGPDAGVVRRQVAAVRGMAYRWDRDKLRPTIDVAANLRVHPAGALLPDAFLRTPWNTVGNTWRLPDCLREADKRCDAFLLDVDGDGRLEIVLTPDEGLGGKVFKEDAQGKWTVLAGLDYPKTDCGALHRDLAAGTIRTVPPLLSDLDIGGVRVHLSPESEGPRCPAK